MGQYYKACYQEKTTKRWKGFTAWDFGSGAKLTEHYFIGNYFVEHLMDTIFRSPKRVVWAGDYADKEEPYKDDQDKGDDYNLYHLCVNRGPRKKLKHSTEEFRFIINHDKKAIIDLSKVEPDKWGWKINPLPILTADGNGRGNGDYHGTLMCLVGIWARDLIEVDSVNSTDYKEVHCPFVEK